MRGPFQKFSRLFFVFLTGFFFYIPGLSASETPVPRTVLILYDSAESSDAFTSRQVIERTSAVILNYLGIKVIYQDISDGLPDDQKMTDVLGVLTWFSDEEMLNAAEYCHWAKRQIEKGKKYIIFGNMGALKDTRTRELTPLETVNELYHAMGLEYEGNGTDNPLVIRIVSKVPERVEFERTLENEAAYYEQVISLREENRVYLTLERTDIPDSRSAAVVTTPQGGLVQTGYAVFFDYYSTQKRWRIDPFRFFEEALDLKGKPRWDTTTLLGRRIFYSHIDGDGFRNISTMDPLKYSSEIILEHILTRYSLPFTVSFIAAEVHPAYFGTEKLIGIAKKIAALPNVEIGVHGFSHPLDWKRKITSFAIKGYSKPLAEMAGDLVSESAYDSGAEVTVGWDEYLKRETDGAAADVNAILPEPKRVVINQWTGNCVPPEEAVRRVTQAGLRNINGGDPRFDRAIPSYTGLAPVVRQVGGEVQVYTSASNENLYTNLWSGPYDGLINVLDTFRQTEVPTLVKAPPRRLSAMNVYYHFYTGERESAIKALESVYDYALKQEIIPIFTSEYADIAHDFTQAKISRTGDGGWQFTEYGAERTVRFDDVNGVPALDRSEEVIGFSRWQNSLYVYLNNAPKARLYFSDREPDRVYLKSASAQIRNWENSGGKIFFETWVFGQGIFRFANLGAKQGYRVTVSALPEPGEKRSFKASSQPDGGFEFHIDQSGHFKVGIEKAG